MRPVSANGGSLSVDREDNRVRASPTKHSSSVKHFVPSFAFRESRLPLVRSPECVLPRCVNRQLLCHARIRSALSGNAHAESSLVLTKTSNDSPAPTRHYFDDTAVIITGAEAAIAQPPVSEARADRRNAANRRAGSQRLSRRQPALQRLPIDVAGSAAMSGHLPPSPTNLRRLLRVEACPLPITATQVQP
jgi:hypothetical protein